MNKETAMLRALNGVALNGYEVALKPDHSSSLGTCVEFKEPVPLSLLAEMFFHEMKKVDEE